MEGERIFMKNKKRLAKLIFVAILLLIIWYTFKDSAGDIVAQLQKTSFAVLVAIMAATVIYHLFEAWITYSLARRYNPKFKFREAVYCAFNCSFYRLSTLGSGSGVAAIVYLGKKGVGYSEATGLYMIQYMVHKVSVALFSGLLFILNWKVMSVNYREYGVYLGLAYALTAIISIALVIFAVSAKSHQLILWIVRKFNKSGKLTPALKKLEEKPEVRVYNLGTGHGYSVLDVVHAFEKACGHEVKYQIKPRRAGDIAMCYCDPTKAKEELGWEAQYGIEEMCQDSWRWQSQNPDGYATEK